MRIELRIKLVSPITFGERAASVESGGLKTLFFIKRNWNSFVEQSKSSFRSNISKLVSRIQNYFESDYLKN